MIFKDKVLLTPTDDGAILVATGEAAKNFNGMMNLNNTSTFIANMLLVGATKDEIIENILKEYDVDIKQATESLEKVLKIFNDYFLLKNE